MSNGLTPSPRNGTGRSLLWIALAMIIGALAGSMSLPSIASGQNSPAPNDVRISTDDARDLAAVVDELKAARRYIAALEAVEKVRNDLDAVRKERDAQEAALRATLEATIAAERRRSAALEDALKAETRRAEILENEVKKRGRAGPILKVAAIAIGAAALIFR